MAGLPLHARQHSAVTLQASRSRRPDTAGTIDLYDPSTTHPPTATRRISRNRPVITPQRFCRRPRHPNCQSKSLHRRHAHTLAPHPCTRVKRSIFTRTAHSGRSDSVQAGTLSATVAPLASEVLRFVPPLDAPGITSPRPTGRGPLTPNLWTWTLHL
jgi:hypothetical protein